jgi:S-adenosylmethionine hydrolase
MAPIVALLSDFGLHDHYVGAMKGALLAACAGAQIVDVTHDLPAHDVRGGALALASVHRAFPGGTVFLAVVDPGVGGPRRGLAAAAGGYHFVAPDNGLLSLVLADHETAEVRALTNAGLFRYEVSSVFHGRDVFAPVAGHLARGGRLEDVGPRVTDAVTLHWPAPRIAGRTCDAEVLHVDRFGNLTTSVRRSDLLALGDDWSDVQVQIAGVRLPLARTYADVAVGEACALIGSSDRLEIAVNQGHAARELPAAVGDPVRVLAPGTEAG